MLVGLAVNLYAQKEAVLWKGKCYEGYVFDTSYLVLKSVKQQQSRAVLSCDEIKIAENILKKIGCFEYQ